MNVHDISSKDHLHISDFSTVEPRLESRQEAFYRRCTKLNEMRLFKKVYSVGDSIFIRTTGQQDQIALISGFYNYIQDDKSIVPLVEVQWYASLYDLPEAFDKDPFSEYELFLTENTNILFIDCIYSKCTVLSLEDFELHQQAYFCRAKYSPTTKVFDPPLTHWKKVCICQTPYNPDHLYIQCDQCENWYHLQCMEMTQEQANAIEEYYCKKCE